MAPSCSTLASEPLVYPQMGAPGFIRWFAACMLGIIGCALILFAISAIPNSAHGRFDGPPAIPAIFLLVGLGAIIGALAIVSYRHRILIDPRAHTITRCRSWGPIRRNAVLAGEVTAVRIMHDTRRTGKNRSGSYTVCALNLVGRRGMLWQLSERPTPAEAFRNMLPSFRSRNAPDYEQVLRHQATALCTATGWQLDDRLESGVNGFVPAASSPGPPSRPNPSAEGPARLAQPPGATPRSQPSSNAAISIFGWSIIVLPTVWIAAHVGLLFWDTHSMRSASAQITGLFRDGSAGNGVGYRFAIDGHEYARWEYGVSGATWTAASKRQSIQVNYLPRDPNRSQLTPPKLIKLPEDWLSKSLMALPYLILAIGIAAAMRRRASRIARAKQLGERGVVGQGMVFRPAQKAGQGRFAVSVAINGINVYDRRPQPQNDPNLVRYEFLAEGKNRFGYIPSDLLGIFRSDGLLAVLYDPHDPDFHLPLPVVERYLRFD